MSPMSPRSRGARRIRLDLVLVLLAFAAAGLVAVGCGGGGSGDDKDKVVLAKVGDVEITASYYEDRLGKLEKNELPRDDGGRFLDMATIAGKKEFLNTMINKEVMVLTAKELGYEKDEEYVQAKKAITSYEAALAMRQRAVDEVARHISDEELMKFYARWDNKRLCRYVITNFLEDAEAARDMARGGADWDDVVRKYHDGGDPPEGKFEITVPFGRYNALYENGVYDTPVGEVTEPIFTTYGYWVLKVDSELEGSKPPLDDVRAKILDITWSRKRAEVMETFKEEVRAGHKLVVNDDALWKCYQGLPADEDIFYPGTKDPRKREDLTPLQIEPADLDMPFYSYVSGGEPHATTLGDYKALYDRMSVFQRPKHSEMLGGVRQKIVGEIDKILLDDESQARGFYEDPVVVSKVDFELQQILVEKLYNATVVIDEHVSPAQLSEFWAEHEKDFFVPELRDGFIVICENEAMAAKARQASLDGETWKVVIAKFETDDGNRQRVGKMTNIRSDATGAGRDVLFSLEEGQISDPFQLDDGRWSVIRCEKINPERQLTLDEAREDAGRRIRQKRSEDAFNALLDKWKKKYEIVINDENLDSVRSWEEVTYVPPLENVVPRN